MLPHGRTVVRMYKITLSPEDRASNTYHPAALWQGRGTNEREQMRRLADALETHLVRCGFAVKNQQGPGMYARVAEANTWPSDLHMALHTNGFDGTVSGTRVHCYPSAESRRMGKLLQDRIASLSPGTSDKLVESATLYELRATRMPAVLPEYGFHDNEEEAKWLVEHIPALAEETAKAVCDYFGVAWVAEEKETPQPTVSYEVRRLENGIVTKTWTLT